MNELNLLDGGEDEARVRGIYVENENWERIEICEPIYDDEDGHRYEMDIINENNYYGDDRKRGWLKCRFDSDKVGHYSVNVLHSRHGRARMPRNGNHNFNSHAIGMAVARPYGFVIDFVRNSISGSTA